MALILTPSTFALGSPAERLTLKALRFSSDSRFCIDRHLHLLMNPVIGLPQSLAQGRGRLPSKIFLDQSIVAIASVHTLGGVEVIVSLQLYPSELLSDID
jgi:hypothetical protein